jgi:uncharacterized membrane protein YbhN (UPF0104 family)
MAAAAVLVAAITVAALAAGWDVRGWLSASWTAFSSVSLVYVVPALALQTLGVVLAGAAWHGILRYAYPDGALSLLGVLACYATGIALNGFLPANAGTLVTVLMFVATIAAATPAGILASAGVEKLFFSLVGALVWVYLFVSVGGSFQRKFGFAAAHPWATSLALAAGCLVLAVVVRLAWRRLRKLWEQVKQGGRILSDPRAYFVRVFLPQFLAWCCRLGFVAVVLAAYAIPVSLHTVLSVAAGNSLANVVSFTPGGIGVSQAFNVASLHGATTAATATASSVGQQLLATVWNVVLAAVLLAMAFGPTAARRLLESSYLGAKAQREEREAPVEGA